VSQLILPLLAVVAIVYLTALALLWRYQERVVFQPPMVPSTAELRALGNVEKVAFSAADGTSLFAYVVGDPGSASFVLLAFHGNADLARWLVPWATQVHRETGAAVVLPEYRGYDGLPDAPTYMSVAQDALAALALVRDEMHVASHRIVYFGHSLGSAVAAELAAAAPPRALILQSPFTSARAMARRMIVPGLGALWRVISRVHYDTVGRVRRLAAPVWVAHGDRDLVIPLRMGREVFAAAARRGELLVVRGAGHDNVDEVGGDAYWDWLRRASRVTSTVSP
jgi:pimeloyl-ACP methyl ester carboxylesterase